MYNAKSLNSNEYKINNEFRCQILSASSIITLYIENSNKNLHILIMRNLLIIIEIEYSPDKN